MIWSIQILIESSLVCFLCIGIGRLFVERNSLAGVVGLALLLWMVTFVGTVSEIGTLNSIAILMISAIVSTAGYLKNKQGAVKDVIIVMSGCLLVYLIFYANNVSHNTFNLDNDSITYLIHSQWLQSNSWSSFTDNDDYLFPAINQVKQYYIAANVARMGQSFFMAWLQKISLIDFSYRVYPVATLVPTVLGSFSAISFFKFTNFGSRLQLLLIVTLGVAFTGLTAAFDLGFYPQTLGLCFAIGFINTSGVIAGILLSGVLVSYPEILPFLLLFLLLKNSLHFKKNIRGCLKEVTVVLCVAIALTAFTLKYIVTGLSRAIAAFGSASTPIGFKVDFDFTSYVEQFVGIKTYSTGIFLVDLLPYEMKLLLLGIFLFPLFAQSKKLRFADKNLMLVLVILFAFFLRVRYLIPAQFDGDVGNSYQQWKVALWASPFLVVLILISSLTYRRRVYFVMLCCFYIVNSIVYYYSKVSGCDFEVYRSVRNELLHSDYVEFVNADRPLFGNRSFTMAYFLMDKKLYGWWSVESSNIKEIPKVYFDKITYCKIATSGDK